MSETSTTLNRQHLERLGRAFHRGAEEASSALSGWLKAPTRMTVDAADQCPLSDVAQVLGDPDQVICLCLMEMQGTLSGHMLLGFDDASGLALADLVLTRATDSSTEWGEVETSCVLETMNIAGSAYLNGLVRELSSYHSEPLELMPTSPVFLRDFAESLLESAFVDQATTESQAVFARSRFEHDGQAYSWTLLLIPSPESLRRLTHWLAESP